MKSLTERLINAWMKGFEKRSGYSKEEIEEMREEAVRQLDKEIKRG